MDEATLRPERRGGVSREQGRTDKLRMNNHPTPTTSDEATLHPMWSTLPLQGRVRGAFAVANVALCNRTALYREGHVHGGGE
jgi:hypothetical protein